MLENTILQLISFIDLTSLSNTDHENSITELISKGNRGFENTHAAAICVYPNFGSYAKSQSHLPVAVVAGSFPSGQTIIEAKVAEYNAVNKTPVDEVDIVINRGLIKAEKFDECASEIRAAREIFDNKHLKVILESGELNEAELRKASQIAMSEGADFIKTSTGKSEMGASDQAASIMCSEIASFYQKTNKKVGFKASGGIREYKDAMNYYTIVDHLLGETWLNPNLFRIGASSLYDNLINQYTNGQ